MERVTSKEWLPTSCFVDKLQLLHVPLFLIYKRVLPMACLKQAIRYTFVRKIKFHIL